MRDVVRDISGGAAISRHDPGSSRVVLDVLRLRRDFGSGPAFCYLRSDKIFAVMTLSEKYIMPLTMYPNTIDSFDFKIDLSFDIHYENHVKSRSQNRLSRLKHWNELRKRRSRLCNRRIDANVEETPTRIVGNSSRPDVRKRPRKSSKKSLRNHPARYQSSRKTTNK